MIIEEITATVKTFFEQKNQSTMRKLVKQAFNTNLRIVL